MSGPVIAGASIRMFVTLGIQMSSAHNLNCSEWTQQIEQNYPFAEWPYPGLLHVRMVRMVVILLLWDCGLLAIAAVVFAINDVHGSKLRHTRFSKWLRSCTQKATEATEQLLASDQESHAAVERLDWPQFAEGVGIHGHQGVESSSAQTLLIVFNVVVICDMLLTSMLGVSCATMDDVYFFMNSSVHVAASSALIMHAYIGHQIAIAGPLRQLKDQYVQAEFNHSFEKRLHGNARKVMFPYSFTCGKLG